MYGYWIPHIYWSHCGGRDNLFGWTVGLTIGWACNLVVVLWVSYVFSREIDGRLAKFVARLQEFCFVKVV